MGVRVGGRTLDDDQADTTPRRGSRTDVPLSCLVSLFLLSLPLPLLCLSLPRALGFEETHGKRLTLGRGLRCRQGSAVVRGDEILF